MVFHRWKSRSSPSIGIHELTWAQVAWISPLSASLNFFARALVTGPTGTWTGSLDVVPRSASFPSSWHEFNWQIRNPRMTNRYEFFFCKAQLKFGMIYKPQKFQHNEFPEVGHESKKKFRIKHNPTTSTVN